jgi:hypothetical protein
MRHSEDSRAGDLGLYSVDHQLWVWKRLCQTPDERNLQISQIDTEDFGKPPTATKSHLAIGSLGCSRFTAREVLPNFGKFRRPLPPQSPVRVSRCNLWTISHGCHVPNRDQLTRLVKISRVDTLSKPLAVLKRPPRSSYPIRKQTTEGKTRKSVEFANAQQPDRF